MQSKHDEVGLMPRLGLIRHSIEFQYSYPHMQRNIIQLENAKVTQSIQKKTTDLLIIRKAFVSLENDNELFPVT